LSPLLLIPLLASKRRDELGDSMLAPGRTLDPARARTELCRMSARQDFAPAIRGE
jgi:hypothetical protein